jgi:hypothetical protein
MPQSIAKYNGQYTGGSGATTVYTCPASTVALIVPNMFIYNGSSGAYTSIRYDSSSAASVSAGNVIFAGPATTNAFVHIASLDKYRISLQAQSAFRNDVRFRPDSGSTNYLGYTESNEAARYVAEHYDMDTGTEAGGSKATGMIVGPWLMDAGNILSLFADNSNNRISYSFMIIEEAV